MTGDGHGSAGRESGDSDRRGTIAPALSWRRWWGWWLCWGCIPPPSPSPPPPAPPPPLPADEDNGKPAPSSRDSRELPWWWWAGTPVCISPPMPPTSPTTTPCPRCPPPTPGPPRAIPPPPGRPAFPLARPPGPAAPETADDMAEDGGSWRCWVIGDDSLTDTIGDTTGGEFLPRPPLLAGVATPSSEPAPIRGHDISRMKKM